MSRLEIDGQFNIDNLCSTCNTVPIEIRQRPVLGDTNNNNNPLTVDQIPNWETFRNNANHVLQEATTLKRQFKWQVTIFYIALVVLFFSGEIQKKIGGIMSIIELICLYIIIMYLIYVTCMVHKKYNVVMQKLRRVATNQSENGVRYVLRDEKYGRFSKGRARRYYILIHMSDEEEIVTRGTPVASGEGRPSLSRSTGIVNGRRGGRDVPVAVAMPPTITPLPIQEPDIPVLPIPIAVPQGHGQGEQRPAITATVVGSGGTTNGGVVSIFDQLRG